MKSSHAVFSGFLFFQMIILSMHLYTLDESHAWFHLYVTSQHARSVKSDKIQIEKSLLIVGLKLTTHIVQIAKRGTSPVFALDMQNTTKYSTVFYLISGLLVESKQDFCVSLLFVQYRYITICNTKQYIYKTKYALLHHSRTTGRTCIFKGHLNSTVFNKVRVIQL